MTGPPKLRPGAEPVVGSGSAATMSKPPTERNTVKSPVTNADKAVPSHV